jgi:hypothetical protein
MPSLPNPYGPATQIGAGLSSITDAIFNMGRAGMMGRYGRQRSAAQDAEDLARAELHKENVAKVRAETLGLTQANQATSPENLNQFAAGISGLDLNTFQRANELNTGGMPAGPIPEYGLVRPGHQDDAALGRAAAIKLQADPKTNLSEITKALYQHKQMQNYTKAMNGQLPVDQFGNVTAAAEGKQRYEMRDGIQFNNQIKGDTFETPLGTANIAASTALGTQRRAAAGESGARTGKINLETKNLQEGKHGPAVVIANPDGTPGHRFLGQVQPTDAAVAPPKNFAPKADPNNPNNARSKRKSINKAEYDSMNNQLADIAGTAFDKIDGPTRAQVLDYASELLVDPSSDWFRNPMGAVSAAVKVMAPAGFHDDTGFFSSANYTARGGVRAAPTRNQAAPNLPTPQAPAGSTAPAKTQGGGLPPEAITQLKEGHTTTFGNGQTWMLQGGVPVQVQ